MTDPGSGHRFGDWLSIVITCGVRQKCCLAALTCLLSTRDCPALWPRLHHWVEQIFGVKLVVVSWGFDQRFGWLSPGNTRTKVVVYRQSNRCCY